MSGSEPGRLVARVRPDVSGLDKSFDYAVPDALAAQVRVGSLVRIPLHGRRVGGWVTELGGSPPAGVALKPIAKLTGRGPSPELIELAAWAARRWAGSDRTFLAASSPPFAVARLPAGRMRESRLAAPLDPVGPAALTGAGAVVRLPPAADALSLVLAAVAHGDALVLTPSVAGAQLLAARLRRVGVPVALHPHDWALAAAGGCGVIGTRSAAWAPMLRLAAVVVLDEHDEAYQEERAPTWHGRDVVVERAARQGVPCVLVSPSPTLEALNGRRLLTLSRAEERAGWPIVEVVDRSRDEPWDTSLLTSTLLRHVRAGQRVVAVVNTTGRARVLACAACRTLARCERCEAGVEQPGDDTLVCRRCGTSRPVVCAACGAGRFRLLRPGVKRLREELEASAGEPVVEVSSATGPLPGLAARLVVGTEAALHQVPAAEVVAFLDFDAELLAPRYRAAEQALALLVRGARLVGDRAGGGRLLVQTRLPHHEVIQAALLADPGRVARAERARREALRFPPFSALAAVSGPAAPAFMETLGRPPGVEVLGPSRGSWLVQAPDHDALSTALLAVPRPPGRLRIEVDPLRV